MLALRCGRLSRLLWVVMRMTDETIHLFPGHDNGDGTVTVTSFISLCCKTVLPSGRATIVPEYANCPGLSAALGGGDQ